MIKQLQDLLPEPLNRVVKSFWETGLINLWEAYDMRSAVLIGKENAQRSTKSNGMKHGSDKDEEQSFLSGFLFRIILLGSRIMKVWLMFMS